MKNRNINLIILFLFIVACSPDLADISINTSGELLIAETIGQDQISPAKMTSTPGLTKTPVPILTTSPSPTPTLLMDYVVERLYEPGVWEILFDKNTVGFIELDLTERMWIYQGGEVGYFEDNQWVFFSPDDYLISPFATGVAIAPDGTVWLSGNQAISRYQNGHWETFPIPDAGVINSTSITIDVSGVIWVGISRCTGCAYSLKKFDGKNWSDVQLWENKRYVNLILFTPDGALWVVDPFGNIGYFDGKTWNIYSEIDLWVPEELARTIKITSDEIGNIYGVSTEQSGQVSWITKVDINGQITKIPVPTKLDFWQNVLRLFVDNQGTIWVNACLDDREDYTCLSYYKDNQWVSFTHMPRNLRMVDFKELADGTLLIASHIGLYKFKPEE